MNYLSEAELNSVKGLMHYLNAHMSPAEACTVVPDVDLIDANGDKAGKITFNADEGGYVLEVLA